MAPERSSYYESLISTYTDNIRASDFRSNILIFFLSISISTLNAFRAELPHFAPIMTLLVFPICSIILLILSIFPRFVVIPGYPFQVSRSVGPDAFPPPSDDEKIILSQLQNRCAAFAKILYWKIFFFRVAIGLCLIYLVTLLLLTIGGAAGAVT